jgi:hypothetical protein
MFIRAHGDRIYVAEPSRKGSRKLIWSVMPRAPVAADVRIEPRRVPLKVRRAAYGLFERDRNRAKAGDPIRALARQTNGPDGKCPPPSGPGIAEITSTLSAVPPSSPTMESTS